ncbi:hypothetical protein ACRRTK_003451 [Alexandromys fortis]
MSFMQFQVTCTALDAQWALDQSSRLSRGTAKFSKEERKGEKSSYLFMTGTWFYSLNL